MKLLYQFHHTSSGTQANPEAPTQKALLTSVHAPSDINTASSPHHMLLEFAASRGGRKQDCKSVEECPLEMHNFWLCDHHISERLSAHTQIGQHEYCPTDSSLLTMKNITTRVASSSGCTVYRLLPFNVHSNIGF